MQTNNIYISKIELKNIACFEQYQIDLAKLNLVKAKNGSGKTTLTKALLSAVSGGNQVELIKNGEPSGEIMIEFSNGIKLNKILNRDGKAKLYLSDETDHVIPKAQTFLDGLFDSYSFNPVQIITATKKERLSLLLESLPMKATKDDFRAIFNGFVDSPAFPEHVLNLHAFDAIEFFVKSIYEKRTDVNSQLKKAKLTNDSLKSSMPNASNSQNIGDDLRKYELEAEEMINNKNQSVNQANEFKQKSIDDLMNRYNHRLAELNEWKANARKLIDESFDKSMRDIERNYQNSYLPVKEEIIKLSVLEKNQAAYQKQAEIIKENEIDIESLTKKTESFTSSLAKLESLKSNFLTDLPVPGLDVKDGEIYFNEIPFDALNTQKQMEIVAKISMLRAGKLGFVFVDGFERLDKENQKIFFEEFAKTELQLLVTEVSDSDMTIEKVA